MHVSLHDRDIMLAFTFGTSYGGHDRNNRHAVPSTSVLAVHICPVCPNALTPLCNAMTTVL